MSENLREIKIVRQNDVGVLSSKGANRNVRLGRVSDGRPMNSLMPGIDQRWHPSRS